MLSQTSKTSSSLVLRTLFRRTASSSTTSSAAEERQKKREKALKKKATHSKSFAQNIFRGIVEPEQVFPFPEPLTADQLETLEMLVPITTKFFEEQNDPLKNDAIETVPDHTVDGLKELGAFGLMVPEEHGGVGLNNTQYARMGEIIGGNDLGLGIFIGAHQSIGYKGIVLCGTDAQKEKYLPRLAAGEDIAAFCLTEPSSGSDASSIKTRAELSPDGSHWIMNGGKIWISNGGMAEVMTVFAKTPVTDSDGNTEDKITAFIVERKFGGVTNGPPEKKMGIKCSNTTEVYYENVPIPKENVLGEVGGGFKVAMQILNNGRFGMGASLSGTMRHVIYKAVDHAINRNQFGSRIDSYGAIQEKIAQMSMRHYATESMAYMVSGVMDKGYSDYQLEAAVSKIYASESAWFVTDEAIQVCGGMGFMRGTGLEKIMRDLRIFRIFEGTNDILRLFIALTGIQYAGGHLRELQKAVSNPISNFGVVLDQVAKRSKTAVGISAANTLTDHVHPNLVESADQICKVTDLLGQNIEKILIKHGKHIIHEQFLLKRLADSVIDIYVMTCVVSRCSKSLNAGIPSAQHEEMMTKIICNEANHRVKNYLKELNNPVILNNYKMMAKISENVCENGTVVQGNVLGVH